jgi:pilus assembly protein CpaB
MSSGALRKISIVTLVLAALLAVLALRMTREVEQPVHDRETVQPAVLQRIIVATGPIEAGAVLQPKNVEVREVAEAPAGAFDRGEQVVGSTTAVALAAGDPILANHLASGAALRGDLLAGERALAVKTDGVVGLGGFVEPGDHVDVLVYLQQDNREIETSQVRVLLRDIRVLAYGARTLRTTPERQPAEARTAVLAVRDDQVPALMLGAHKGQLRLALRAEPTDGEREPDDRVATLSDLLGSTDPPSPVDRHRVVVYRGTERQELTP